MKEPGKLIRTALALAVISMGACVTINIYFPAEKVESVAGEIVQEVRGLKPEEETGTPPQKKSSSLQRQLLVASLVSAAWAAEEVTTVSNPTIRALKQQMKDRFPLLKPHFTSGVLQEGAEGFVVIANTGALSLKDKRDVTGLVDAENKDRRALYQEVAKALNIDPSQTGRVATIFAKEWQKSLQ
jgi:uncharacterized protein YdbL (DUF1318 family)